MRTSTRIQTVWLPLLGAITLTLLLTAAPVSAQDPGLPYPNTAEVSDQKTGSILFFNLYTSASSHPAWLTHNTEISITNTHLTASVTIRLFFVADSGPVARAFILMQPLRTVSLLASDLDPGVSGYLVALAVDGVTGCPIKFNYLMGDAHIKLPSGHAASLGAVAIAAQAATPASCIGLTTLLSFDNVNYNRLPRVLVAESIVSRVDGNDTLLVLNRVGGNFAPGGIAASIGLLTGLLLDDAASGFPFLQGSLGPQLRSALTNSFPSTTPPFQTAIPSGRTGWMKLYGSGDLALLGAVINTDPNAGVSAGAFNHGHNLTYQTLTSAANLTVPIGIPDLTISKTHTGSFTIGGMGSYTITVTNSGTGVVSGKTTVTDYVPGNLTLSTFSGTGWVCDLGIVAGTVVCTNTSAVNPTASYPALTLNFNVGPGTPSGVNSIENAVDVSSFDELNAGNNRATDFTTVNNPMPILNSLSPNVALAGSTGFTLVVSGGNFVSGSVVRWNGNERTTTFISATQLTAQIPASDIAIGGNAAVLVFNPAPGGGPSNARSFTINNPMPALTGIAPTTAAAGGTGFTLTVNGSNFVPSSVVRWNGGDHATTFVNSTHLAAQIPAGDIAATGTALVTVFNPAPGGGTSNAATFTINNFEIDVAPRNTLGNGVVSIADWLQVGRFAVRLDVAGNGGEFQKADCAPRGVRGNGRISIADWAQAGRYASGVDAPQTAAGPTSETAGPSQVFGGARTVRAVNAAFTRGQTNTLTVELVALGNENALGFTLVYDPAILSNPLAALGSGASSATLIVNTSQAAQGLLGVGLALPSGQAFAAGTRQLLTVSFVTAANSNPNSTAVSFSDQVVDREAADANADLLSATYSGGTITLNPPLNPVPVLTSLSPATAAGGGPAFTLTLNGSNFVPGSVVRWDGVDRMTTFIDTTRLTAQIPAGDIAVAGMPMVTVFNPAPGGGVSNALPFTVTQTAGLMYYPLPRPIRLFDTRASIPGFAACEYLNQPLAADGELVKQSRITCDGVTIPASAQAIVGNATVVAPAAAGYVTIWPDGQARPPVSNLNYAAGQVVPNSFTVGLSSAGNFRVYSYAATHFIVDITGYFAPPGAGGLYYHPLPKPIRLFDTRAPIPGFAACEYLNQPLLADSELARQARITCDGITIPADASAIVGNATVIGLASPGFITLWPNGQPRPPVSNLNHEAGQVIPNAFTTGLGADGQFRIYSYAQDHFIVDVTGYYSPSATDANGPGLLYQPLPNPIRLFDTRAPFPGFPACEYLNQPLAADAEFVKQARVTCNGVTIPATAQAITGNATVVAPAGLGFATLWPNGQTRPPVSNLNYLAGQVVPNAFTVGLGADGQFRIYTYAATHFITDVTGYFAP